MASARGSGKSLLLGGLGARALLVLAAEIGLPGVAVETEPALGPVEQVADHDAVLGVGGEAPDLELDHASVGVDHLGRLGVGRLLGRSLAVEAAARADLAGMPVLAEPPAGDVPLVRPLVADVAVAVIPVPVPVVVEAVVVEGALGGRAEPGVVIDLLQVGPVVVHAGLVPDEVAVRLARPDAVGDEADGIAGLEAQAAGHVDLADAAAVEEGHGLADGPAGPVLEADRDHAAVAAGGLDHAPPFPDVVAAGLLDEDVLARLAGPDRAQGVPVVGRGDRYGVDAAVREQLLLMLIGRRLVAERLLHVGGSLGQDVQIDVAERGDPDVRHRAERVDVVQAAAPDADDRQVDAVVGTGGLSGGPGRRPAGSRRGQDSGGQGAGGESAARPEEISSGDAIIDGHVTLLISVLPASGSPS